MMKRALLALTLLAAACGDDDASDDRTPIDMGPLPTDDLGTLDMATADMEVGPDMGPPETCEGTAAVDPLPPSGFLVLSSDFASTAIGVVAADGSGVADERWVDSSTAAAGLVAALSGDVVLPTEMPPLGAAIIDRANDTVTRFCTSGALVGQVRVGTDENDANPQDVLFRAGTQAGWVSRYEPHPGAAAVQDRGSDLIGLDTAAMTRDGMRIDLSGFGGTVTGLDMDGMEAEVDVVARPQSIVQVHDHAVVGLDRIPSLLFGGPRGHLPGAVAIVPLEGGDPALHELTDLANCGRVTPVPGDEELVLVACSGYSDRFFGDTEMERASAGLALLRVDAAGAVSEEAVWRVADDAARLAAVEGTIALDAERVLGVSWGVWGASGDDLVVTNLTTGAQETVDSATDAFALGEPAIRGAVVLVPDASSGAPSVWRYSVGADALTRDGELTVDPVLPPRLVRAY